MQTHKQIKLRIVNQSLVVGSGDGVQIKFIVSVWLAFYAGHFCVEGAEEQFRRFTVVGQFPGLVVEGYLAGNKVG